MHIKTSKIQGLLYKILYLIASAISIILNKQSLKSLGSCQLFFLSSLFGFILISFFIKVIKKKSLWVLTKKINSQYLLRSSFNTMGRTFWLFGLITIDTTIATTIVYLRPIFSVLIAILFLGEKITYKITSGLLIGILGALCVIGPVMTQPNPMNILAVTAILLAPLALALYDVTVKAQSQNGHWAEQAYSVFLLTSILSFPLALIDWKLLHFNVIPIVFLLGLFFIIMEMSLVNALKRITLVLAAPVDFLRIVFIAILAYIFLGETVTFATLLGCTLIILATLIIFTKIPIQKEAELQIEEPI